MFHWYESNPVKVLPAFAPSYRHIFRIAFPPTWLGRLFGYDDKVEYYIQHTATGCWYTWPDFRGVGARTARELDSLARRIDWAAES